MLTLNPAQFYSPRSNYGINRANQPGFGAKFKSVDGAIVISRETWQRLYRVIDGNEKDANGGRLDLNGEIEAYEQIIEDLKDANKYIAEKVRTAYNHLRKTARGAKQFEAWGVINANNEQIIPEAQQSLERARKELEKKIRLSRIP